MSCCCVEPYAVSTHSSYTIKHTLGFWQQEGGFRSAGSISVIIQWRRLPSNLSEICLSLIVTAENSGFKQQTHITEKITTFQSKHTYLAGEGPSGPTHHASSFLHPSAYRNGFRFHTQPTTVIRINQRCPHLNGKHDAKIIHQGQILLDVSWWKMWKCSQPQSCTSLDNMRLFLKEISSLIKDGGYHDAWFLMNV